MKGKGVHKHMDERPLSLVYRNFSRICIIAQIGRQFKSRADDVSGSPVEEAAEKFSFFSNL
jgi:hypothetical protein